MASSRLAATTRNRPIRRPADRPSALIQHHHVARQILIHRPQPVIEPRAERRMPLDDPPAVHLKHRRAVGEAVGIQRFDDRDLVHLRREMGQRVGAPLAGLAVLPKSALRPEQLAGLNRTSALLEIRCLTVPPLQFGFVVEQVHLRRTAVHEEKDAGLGADARECRRGPEVCQIGDGCSSPGRKKALPIQQGTEGETGETRAHFPQELPARPAARIR